MKISCVLHAQELTETTPDIIVFPEGVCADEIMEAFHKFPTSILVGAIEDTGYCRGLLIHEGQNKVDYLKVQTDGNTTGRSNVQQSPVCEFHDLDLCIGMLICMDIQHHVFARSVLERIKASRCGWKILCIPGDMDLTWFGDGNLPPQYHDIYVIMCNHKKSHPQDRKRSFIASPLGEKIYEQFGLEPIHFQIS